MSDQVEQVEPVEQVVEPPVETVVAYFDGICEPRNPGGYGCGGYVVEPFSKAPEGLRGGKCFGHGAGMTNNVAEYGAAIHVLREIYKTGHRGPVLLWGDSQLVVNQFSRKWRCNAELLIPLLAQLHKAETAFTSLTLEWLPRTENHRADHESRLAYTAETGEEPPHPGPTDEIRIEIEKPPRSLTKRKNPSMTSPTTTTTITAEEQAAYKRFSKECAKVEKGLYGKTTFQDKKLTALFGKDTKSDWAQTFEWTLSIKRMFDREGTEAFLSKVAPELVTRLLGVEKKTKTFLTLARALLNGLGWGVSGPPLGAGGPAPPIDPMESTAIPPRLAVTPDCVFPPAPEQVDPSTSETTDPEVPVEGSGTPVETPQSPVGTPQSPESGAQDPKPGC